MRKGLLLHNYADCKPTTLPPEWEEVSRLTPSSTQQLPSLAQFSADPELILVL